MTPFSDKPRFHVCPPQGWLNDPNGLCQFKGSYHAFFQYSPLWPKDETRSWGHAISSDLLHWQDLGEAISPTIPEDKDGVYSGCAYVAPDASELRFYYTGNVIHQGNYDYVLDGREANEILVCSQDGRTFSTKEVVLRTKDYPTECSRHVRDPKVWAEEESLWMVLGARTTLDSGQVLVYQSSNGHSWHYHHSICSHTTFGYMWECPNVVSLDGRSFLAVCPQGLTSEPLRFHNRWQAGYFPLENSVLDTRVVDETRFVEWDFGFDFYAPQVFKDEKGRLLLLGWMGSFDKEWTSAPEGLEWCHCLTLARELHIDNHGLLRQLPVRELEACRKEEQLLDSNCELPEHSFDIELQGITTQGSLTLDGVLQFDISKSCLKVRFLDESVGAGRPNRTVPLPSLPENLRLVVDASTAELYLDSGRIVFSTRWFPKKSQASIATTIEAGSSHVWQLQ